ncbi:MAG: hypothetical protein AAFZ63_23345 [Bacteroidota bacterium]
MIRMILEGFLNDPRAMISFMGALPGLIATIFMALVGHHFWFHKVGSHFRMIGLGALFAVLAYIAGFGTNYFFASYLPIEQFIVVISINSGIGGLGHLLFCYGIYQWIRMKVSSDDLAPTSNRGPFMS